MFGLSDMLERAQRGAKPALMLHLLLSNHVLPVLSYRSTLHDLTVEVSGAELTLHGTTGTGADAEMCNMFSSMKEKHYYFDVELSETPCEEDGECMALELHRVKGAPLLDFHMGYEWQAKSHVERKGRKETFHLDGFDLSEPYAAPNKVQNGTLNLSQVRNIKLYKATKDDPETLDIIDADGRNLFITGGVYYAADIMERGMDYHYRQSQDIWFLFDTRKRGLFWKSQKTMDFELEENPRGVVRVAKIYGNHSNGILSRWNEKKIKYREPWLTVQVGDIVSKIDRKRPRSVAEAKKKLKDNSHAEVYFHHQESTDNENRAADLKLGADVLVTSGHHVSTHMANGAGTGAKYLFGIGMVGGSAVAAQGATTGLAVTASYIATEAALGAMHGAMLGAFWGAAAGVAVGTVYGVQHVLRKSSQMRMNKKMFASEKIFSKLWCMTDDFKRCKCTTGIKGKCWMVVPKNQDCPAENEDKDELLETKTMEKQGKDEEGTQSKEDETTTKKTEEAGSEKEVETTETKTKKEDEARGSEKSDGASTTDEKEHVPGSADADEEEKQADDTKTHETKA